MKTMTQVTSQALHKAGKRSGRKDESSYDCRKFAGTVQTGRDYGFQVSTYNSPAQNDYKIKNEIENYHY